MDIVVIFEGQEMGEVELLSQIYNFQQLVTEINKIEQCPTDDEGDLIVINECDEIQYQEIYVIESQDGEGVNKIQKEVIIPQDIQQFQQTSNENLNIRLIENLLNAKIETRIEQLIADFGLKQVINQNHIQDKGQDIYQDLINTLSELSHIHNEIKQVNDDENFNQLIQVQKIKSGIVREYYAKIKNALTSDIAEAKKRIDQRKRQQQKQKK